MAVGIFFLSLLASLLSIFATLPQILKIVQSASTKDLSLCCFAMHSVAGILWCVYGAAIQAYVLAAEAAIVSVMNIVVCVHILEQTHISNIDGI